SSLCDDIRFDAQSDEKNVDSEEDYEEELARARRGKKKEGNLYDVGENRADASIQPNPRESGRKRYARRQDIQVRRSTGRHQGHQDKKRRPNMAPISREKVAHRPDSIHDLRNISFQLVEDGNTFLNDQSHDDRDDNNADD